MNAPDVYSRKYGITSYKYIYIFTQIIHVFNFNTHNCSSSIISRKGIDFLMCSLENPFTETWISYWSNAGHGASTIRWAYEWICRVNLNDSSFEYLNEIIDIYFRVFWKLGNQGFSHFLAVFLLSCSLILQGSKGTDRRELQYNSYFFAAYLNIVFEKSQDLALV